LRLNNFLDNLTQRGIHHVAFEATSHGLDQYRLDGVPLCAAAFTQLTQDHLDYHGSMEVYFQAKARLFLALLPDDKTAIINQDCPYGMRLIHMIKQQRPHIQCLTTSRQNMADMYAHNIRMKGHSHVFDLTLMGRTYSDIEFSVCGDFQIENLLTAIGLVYASGVSVDNVMKAIPLLTAAAGRLECVGQIKGAYFYVDYAHTPDALEKALVHLRPFTRNKLWVVFGCGGNRDAGKRPIMGDIARRLADCVVITDDNPRFEDPSCIRSQIKTACPDGTEIGNRRDAFAFVCDQVNDGDTVLIAGKGHENGQIIGGTVFPFDDRDEILTLIRETRPCP
jgi:UDP-N-acetylmuramoyl-L-alanyl-D-glutamate--2,6-diaminopimelate ligase